MHSQLLEIYYEDYIDVDVKCLESVSDQVMTFMAENMTDNKPYKVEGTRSQSNSSEWHKTRWCRLTALNAKDIASTKSRQGQ